MKRIALVVEGLGDRKAFPTLVAKTAAIFDKQIYVVHLVEGGGWSALKKDRELERNCLLAASEGTPDEIIVVVDLEDDCARLEAQAIDARVKQASVETGLLIKVCFCVREYETWFLEGLSGIVENSPEIGWVTTSVTPKQCQVEVPRKRLSGH